MNQKIKYDFSLPPTDTLWLKYFEGGHKSIPKYPRRSKYAMKILVLIVFAIFLKVTIFVQLIWIIVELDYQSNILIKGCFTTSTNCNHKRKCLRLFAKDYNNVST